MTTTVTFATVPISTTTEDIGLAGGSTSGTPPSLAFTGVSVLGPILAALALVAGGIGLLLLQRRRGSRRA